MIRLFRLYLAHRTYLNACRKTPPFEALAELRAAIAMEARRAETVKHGSVGDDSAAIAQPHPKGQARSNKSRPVT